MKKAEVFLGIRITSRQDGGYLLDQEDMINKLVIQYEKEFNTILKPRETPSRKCHKTEEGVSSLTLQRIQHCVGAILWLARGTQPGISQATHELTQVVHDWGGISSDRNLDT
eukprot:GHVN01104019.1.p2 GENE.GHVN01104019.1~~GHVN01104019.1.p2  ORF type:complete len:112 (-),score=1.93 GHVN01104019.1:626-961(-)